MINRQNRYSTLQGWQQPLDELCTDMDGPQTWVLVFASRVLEDNAEFWQQLTSAFPNSLITGCSSAGEIFQDEVYDDSAVLSVVQFADTQLRCFAEPVTMQTGYATGESLAKQLAAGEDALQGVFVLSEGLKINGTDLAQGLSDGLPKIIITGGLAGDGVDFGHTWVLVDGRPRTGYVTALGFYGDKVQIGYGSQGGWDIFGPQRLVTAAKDNQLFELDGRPALELYKSYLGELAQGLPASGLLFPIAILNEGEEPITRTVLAVDEATQSLTFAGDIPQGKRVQLMRANFEHLINGAEDAAQAVLDSYRGVLAQEANYLAIAVSCIGRKLILKERIDEETEVTLERFPSNTSQIGFYSYGELSPQVFAQNSLQCQLHNQTMTLTLISEISA